MNAPDEVPSPCVGVCRIDSVRERCDGCLRSLDEIARWGGLGADEKRALLAELGARRQREAAERTDGGGIE